MLVLAADARPRQPRRRRHPRRNLQPRRSPSLPALRHPSTPVLAADARPRQPRQNLQPRRSPSHAVLPAASSTSRRHPSSLPRVLHYQPSLPSLDLLFLFAVAVNLEVSPSTPQTTPSGPCTSASRVGESTEDQEDGGGDDHNSKDRVGDGHSGGVRDGEDRNHEDKEGRYHEGPGHRGQFVYVNSDDE
ncbi:unnamed protein product [Cuscuta campestris]|uniref:Uncharacterized protein n=1 Tax=Cuscuta campestris TaxID=132261 RepID=A0A484LY74_9ASTE|nr:unnamed protein product [Cuscuta campestris]